MNIRSCRRKGSSIPSQRLLRRRKYSCIYHDRGLPKEKKKSLQNRTGRPKDKHKKKGGGGRDKVLPVNCVDKRNGQFGRVVSRWESCDTGGPEGRLTLHEDQPRETSKMARKRKKDGPKRMKDKGNDRKWDYKHWKEGSSWRGQPTPSQKRPLTGCELLSSIRFDFPTLVPIATKKRPPAHTDKSNKWTSPTIFCALLFRDRGTWHKLVNETQREAKATKQRDDVTGSLKWSKQKIENLPVSGPSTTHMLCYMHSLFILILSEMITAHSCWAMRHFYRSLANHGTQLP